MNITPKKAFELIQATRGEFIKVKFVKRSTGEHREILCQYGVHRHLKGGPRAYDPAGKNLVVVWDCGDRKYKSIPLEGLKEVRMGGQVYTIDDALEIMA